MITIEILLENFILSHLNYSVNNSVNKKIK